MTYPTIKLALATAVVLSTPLLGQQVADTAFKPPIKRPAYAQGKGPTLCVDEGHYNFHTLGNRFRAFGSLAERDGYVLKPSGGQFSANSLRECRIFVISNAHPNDDEWNTYPTPTPSAFTDVEIATLKKWVEGGGRLLLIADHMPLAGAAEKLAGAFGVAFTDGFAVKTFETEVGRDSAFGTPTLFRPTDGTLAAHPIVWGRDSTEAVTQVRSFTGQAFRATAATVAPLMVLPADFVSLEPRYAWQFSPTTPRRDVGGWLQGATTKVGRGRVAFFGEAAMFTAQVAGPNRTPMGMNAPLAAENPQFVLNTLHWLSGLIDP